MDQLHSSIALFVVLLLAALSLDMLAERIRRPYTATLMLASAAVYLPIYQSDLDRHCSWCSCRL